MQQAEKEAWREAQGKALLSQINGLSGQYLDCMQALGFYAIMRSPAMLQKYERVSRNIPRQFKSIRQLALLMPARDRYLAEIDIMSDRGLKLLDSARTAVESEDNFVSSTQLKKIASDTAQFVNDFSESVRKINREEKYGEVEGVMLANVQRKRLETVIVVGIASAILLAILLAAFFNSGILRRLAILIDNTRKLAAGEKMNQPLSGKDEITQLDTSLHAMAKALAEAARTERAVLNQASAMLCSLDERGSFLLVNPASEKLLGFKSNDLAGRVASEVVLHDDRERFQIAVTDGKSKNDFGLEVSMIGSDGRIVETLWSLRWSEEDHSYFCVVTDITDRKELERLKQQFVATVSHDLRSPLSSIKITHDLILDGYLGSVDPKITKKLTAANKTVTRMMSMIGTLLDLEKLDSGKLDMNLELVDVSELFQTLEDSVGEHVRKSSIRLELQPVELRVIADKERCAQVLTNLVGNAVKFSPAGSTITLSAEPIADDMVKVSVADEGRGIPEEFCQKIFERFQQVSGEDTKKGGLGLGLSICKSFVELQGGTIGVNSGRGKGSTFWFTLPIAKEVED